MGKKTTRLTIETERLLVFTSSQRLIEGWCPDCAADVTMANVEEAGIIAGLTQRNLFSLAEAGEIHFIETEEGKAMFCLNSLPKKKTLIARSSARP